MKVDGIDVDFAAKALLDKYKRQNAAPEAAMLKVKDVAVHLGICKGDVGTLIRSGKLRAINVGKGSLKPRWRIDPTWLEEFKTLRAAASEPLPPRKRPRPEYERLV